MNPPSMGKQKQSLNHTVAPELLMNGLLSARKLAAILTTLLEDMNRLYNLGRYWCDGKASNVVFVMEDDTPRAYMIDFGAAIRREEAIVDSLIAFGRIMS